MLTHTCTHTVSPLQSALHYMNMVHRNNVMVCCTESVTLASLHPPPALLACESGQRGDDVSARPHHRALRVRDGHSPSISRDSRPYFSRGSRPLARTLISAPVGSCSSSCTSPPYTPSSKPTSCALASLMGQNFFGRPGL